jgi:hypothetical protein
MWRRNPFSSQERAAVLTLYWPDGSAMSEDETAMALALKSGCAIGGMEAIDERSDGRRIPLLSFCHAAV